ncbi:response regulator transcription factor [Thomasclavelia sp.]|uniref:helix-turn-helix domain-containing protein n=1 Tax=Thomasclavelia sp. TaxID=3025757 RepID=UPI0025D869F1|nr:response regulator transcription factor [Thomasclavelia sp.]
MFEYEKIELDYNLPIKLVDLYFENHDTKTLKHWHNSIEILVPILGDLVLYLNTKEIIIHSGSIYIINSQELHGMHHSKDTEIYKGYALQINYDYIHSYFPKIDNYYFLQPDVNCQKKILNNIFQIINAYNNQDKYVNIKIHSCLLDILYLMCTSAIIKKQDMPYEINSVHDKRIMQMTKYIEQHYLDKLTVTSIADHFDMSPGYLSQYFKTHLNMTVKEYINFVRLEKAHKDLIHTEYSLIDIAYMNGYPNLKSFINDFKKNYNQTPAKYRKNIRKQPQ